MVGGTVSCLSARRRPGVGAGRREHPPYPRPPIPEDRRCATGHPTVASRKPGAARKGRFQNGRRGHQAPSPPRAPREREGGHHGQATVTLQSPGVQRGAGGAGRRELGWVGGRGRASERGRERNKRSLCGAGQGEERAHYPMPRSHVGNKRSILCLAWKTTWSRERQGEI